MVVALLYYLYHNPGTQGLSFNLQPIWQSASSTNPPVSATTAMGLQGVKHVATLSIFNMGAEVYTQALMLYSSTVTHEPPVQPVVAWMKMVPIDS